MNTLCISVSIPGHRQPSGRLRHYSGETFRYPLLLSIPNRSTFLVPLSIASYRSSPLSSSLQNPVQTGRFLTDEEIEKIKFLENYSYHQELESGFLWVRAMRKEELEMTAFLLAECFAESMMMGQSYVKLLGFMVKNYLSERRQLLPHTATLLGVYRANGEEDFELAGTVELSFCREGANLNPSTPTPPLDSPYICNMAVRNPIRRRGIGWHLLKAGEELITKMSPAREVYLHCRMIDEGPFNMYRKAGYFIVKTDSFLTLLTLQRRKHLMRKELISETEADE